MNLKTFLLICLTVISFPSLLMAQKEQVPDTLLWNNRRYAITVHRDVPSILMVYYQRKQTTSPFTYWSSDNNRGHVATFELMNNSICLSSIQALRFKTRGSSLWSASGIDTTVSPDYFDITPMSPNDDNLVVADWFSGVIQLSLIVTDKSESKSREATHHHLLLITNGKVERDVLIPNNKAKLNDSQISMQLLQKRYLNFYVRSACDYERVNYNGHWGRFDKAPNSSTLFMGRYKNSPLAWPHSWTDSSSCSGAPFGVWTIRNDSVFITALATHSSKELTSYDSCNLQIFKYFAPELPFPDGSFLADWLNGQYVIHYGNNIIDQYGQPDYLIAKTQKIRVQNGIILSSQFSPRGFDEDSAELVSLDFPLCNENSVWSVDDKQLVEVVGKLPAPKKAPSFDGDKAALRGWFQSRPLTDDRAKSRLFRVRIGFIVNCEGKIGNFQIINKPKGELFEFSNMVLEIVKEMPANWLPASDKKGNPVDCWQVIEFTVSNGQLTNANYK